MTSEELDALRENTIASNQRTIATALELQARLTQIQAEQAARMDRIEAMFASILERLDRLESLNRNAIGFATGET